MSVVLICNTFVPSQGVCQREFDGPDARERFDEHALLVHGRPPTYSPWRGLAAFSAGAADYRYALGRRLGLLGSGRLLAICLNPSTADETTDDPTVRRLMGIGRREGFAELVVANLFALRSTDPTALRNHPDPVGHPLNDVWIAKLADDADKIVVAWGNHGALRSRDVAVRKLLEDHELWCLGATTKEWQPRHPLYLRGAVPLERFRGW